MDLWVVAVATGAGYIAKNLQNLSVDNKRENPGSGSAESRNFVQQLRDKTCPLRKLAQEGNSSLEDQLRIRDSGLASSSHGWISLPNTVGGVVEGRSRNLGRVRQGKIHMEDNSCLFPILNGDGSRRETANFDASGKSFHPQGGESMLLFISGMIVGILSASTSWRNEVDKSKQVLRQMHNLVEDLQEELDMKEMLMVKELTDEGPHDTFSVIEAQLQAELEMLEQNINAPLDRDFEEPEIVRGELKPQIVNDMFESGNETTESATDEYSHPANYAVSPWELSLRLHEVIESRLQMRINELEIALGSQHDKREDVSNEVTEPDTSLELVLDIPHSDSDWESDNE